MVTPDTLRLPVNLPSPKIPLQHNPMYLPVSGHVTPTDQHVSPICATMTTVATTQTMPPCRSISCQVSIANHKRPKTPELKTAEPQLRRSHSARRHKERNHRDVASRAQDDCLTNRDVHSIKSKLNKVQAKGKV